MKSARIVLAVALFALIVVMGYGLAAALGGLGPQSATDLDPGNDFLISRTAQDGHNGPAIAYNDDLDEYLVVWEDRRNDVVFADIMGQFVTTEGIPKGDNFVIRDEPTHGLVSPAVAYDTVNERYLVVWRDNQEYEIEGQMVSSDGSLYGSAFDVAFGAAASEPMEPAAACYAHATDGVCTVAYSRVEAGQADVYSRRVDVEGGVVGSEIAVCTEGEDQLGPELAVNPATGDFVIVWNDDRGPAWSIRGRVQAHNGGLGPDFSVSTSSSVDRYEPAVAFVPEAGSGGEWLVVFYRQLAAGTQISGRRVTAAGAATGDLLDICLDEGNQFSPEVAYNSSSQESLVVFADDRLGTAHFEIYAQRVDLEGNRSGGSFRVAAASGFFVSPAMLPVVAASPAAPGYLAVFEGVIPGLEGQRVGVDGSLQGHEIAIVAPMTDQTRPAIGYNSNLPGYLVAWQDSRGGDWDIWGQRVDLYGVVQEQGLEICLEGGGQTGPDLAHNPNTDQYLVVWQDARSGTAQVYGRRVDGDGVLSEAEFLIAGGDANVRRSPRVEYNPVSDEYLVVYAHGVESGNIRGRRIPASGLPSEAEFDIATGAAAQTFPEVACRSREGMGGYLVVWREQDGAQNDIRGRRLTRNGAHQGDLLDICVQGDDQWHPHVDYSPDGDNYFVIWPDDRNIVAQGRDIYGRQVGAAGLLKAEVAITTAAEKQAHPDLTYSAALSSYVVVWDDERNAAVAPDIYAQLVGNDGALQDTDAGTNELIFEFSGWQQYPGIAWDDEESLGLIAWQDGRNGDNFDIYGLQVGVAEIKVFLPLVLKEG